MNLNVDMMASPNGVRSIHDGDGADLGPAGGLFSGDVEKKTKTQVQTYGAPPVKNSIPATTRPATPSAIPTRTCSRKCPGPWLTPPQPTHSPRAAEQPRLAHSGEPRTTKHAGPIPPIHGRAGAEQVKLSHDDLSRGARPHDPVRG